MQLFSIPFLIFVIVGLMLFHSCRTSGQRRFIFLLLNVVFLTSHVQSLKALLPMALYIAFCLFAIYSLNRWKVRALLVGSIAILVTLFLYLKCYFLTLLVAPLPFIYTSVGLSFVLFRVLHLLVDTYQYEGPRHDLRISSLLNYMISFLSLTAGPLQRFEDYWRQESAWDQASLVSLDGLYYAALRITGGYIKLVFIAPLFLELHNYLLSKMVEYMLAFGGAAFAYMLFVYMNFSGYMDIAIGLGKLFGLTLPENFNMPVFASSFLDLWSRWHITLSTWFKTYLFSPLVRFLCLRSTSPAWLPYFGAFAYFFC